MVNQLLMVIHLLQLPYFLSDDDIATVTIVVIQAFGESLKRPYPSDTSQRIKDFLNAVAIPYSKLNDYDNVTILKEKITREYVGGSRGMSY